jgi:GT2 family glycosyltransferase
MTVIVPATDGPASLPRCLDAIRSADEPAEELIVVTDPPLVGPAEARNAGAARASGDVLVFVDSDVVVHADALARIRAAFDRNTELTALFGSYDDDPPAAGRVSSFRNLLHHHVHHASPGPATTFWAGLGAVRRDVFEASGGFDAQRFPRPSVEDVELGTRLFRSGALIVLDPAVQGAHLKSWTLRQMIATDFARRGIPWIALMLRTRSTSGALNLGWRHRLSAAACLLTLAALAWRPVLAVASFAAFVCLNLAFYGLIARRRGAAAMVQGIALHAVHHLTAVAAVPAGIAAQLRSSLAARRER